MTELTIEEKAAKIRAYALKVHNLRGLRPQGHTRREDIVEYALQENFSMDSTERHELAKELVKQNVQINIGNKNVDVKELRDDVRERVENPVELKPLSTWVEDAKDVINNMTDGDITPQDINQRQDFLKSIDDREHELQTLLNMYRTNVLPNSQEMIWMLSKRLEEIQKIKAAVKKSTKETEQALNNQEISPQELHKAKIYMGVLDYMLEDKHIPDAMKVKLELNGGVGFEYSLAEEMYNKNSLNDKNKIIDRISQLRGRQQANNVAKSDIRKMQFDKDLYYKLQEQRQLNRV